MILNNKLKKILIDLCESHYVDKMYLFGSASTDNLKENSDIDFLVKFKNFDLAKYFENYISLKENLSKLFNRNIDLVEEQAIKNPILVNSINKSKELIYG